MPKKHRKRLLDKTNLDIRGFFMAILLVTILLSLMFLYSKFLESTLNIILK